MDRRKIIAIGLLLAAAVGYFFLRNRGGGAGDSSQVVPAGDASTTGQSSGAVDGTGGASAQALLTTLQGENAALIGQLVAANTVLLGGQQVSEPSPPMFPGGDGRLPAGAVAPAAVDRPAVPDVPAQYADGARPPMPTVNGQAPDVSAATATTSGELADANPADAVPAGATGSAEPVSRFYVPATGASAYDVATPLQPAQGRTGSLRPPAAVERPTVPA